MSERKQDKAQERGMPSGMTEPTAYYGNVLFPWPSRKDNANPIALQAGGLGYGRQPLKA